MLFIREKEMKVTNTLLRKSRLAVRYWIFSYFLSDKNEGNFTWICTFIQNHLCGKTTVRIRITRHSGVMVKWEEFTSTEICCETETVCFDLSSKNSVSNSLWRYDNSPIMNKYFPNEREERLSLSQNCGAEVLGYGLRSDHYCQ